MLLFSLSWSHSSINGCLFWSIFPALWLPFSCLDATAVQTPILPADSVSSLRRWGLGVLVATREEEGGESEAPTSGPASLSHAREKSWLIVSTMANCHTAPQNRSPHQHFYSIIPLFLRKPHVMHVSPQEREETPCSDEKNHRDWPKFLTFCRKAERRVFICFSKYFSACRHEIWIHFFFF